MQNKSYDIAENNLLSTHPLVVLENVSIGYGNAKIVARKLSATIECGRVVCLLGSNGTGKSTLIRTLCGFQHALEGQIVLNDKPLSAYSPQKLSKELSVVLTDKVDIANATVEEFVAYGRSPYTNFLGQLTDDDKTIVETAMVNCRIIHKRNEYIANLSDGEKQKAVIAKSIAQNTPLIILDEPTAFLDLPARVEIMQLLRMLAVKANKAILMSTHDMDLALQMADKLWILHKNGPITEGCPEDLLLSGSFNTLFGESNITFDIKTGLFKVFHDYKYVLPVKGHGFHYTLLRRAFARNGINLVQAGEEKTLLLEINPQNPDVYSFYADNILLQSTNSIEKLLEIVIQKLSTTHSTAKHQENSSYDHLF